MALPSDPSGAATVVATGASLHVPDARGTQLISAELIERYDVASALFVPVAYDGEVRRWRSCSRACSREFDADEVATAEALAGVAAAGLRAARGRAPARRPRRPRSCARPRREGAQHVAGARGGAAHVRARGSERGRRRRRRRLRRQRDRRRHRHGRPQRGGGLARRPGGPRRGRGRHGAADRRDVRHQRLPARRAAAAASLDGPFPHRDRGPDGLEPGAQGRAVGRLEDDAADRGRGPPHARGDRRPRDRRLPQRRDVPQRAAGRAHRRAHRTAQPRRDAGARARGDRARPARQARR